MPTDISAWTWLATASPQVLFLFGLIWVAKAWRADRAEATATNEKRHAELLELVREYHEAAKATMLTLERLAERLNDQK